jgi:hypothetical protein
VVIVTTDYIRGDLNVSGMLCGKAGIPSLNTDLLMGMLVSLQHSEYRCVGFRVL